MNAEKDSIHPEIIYVDSEESVYVEATLQWCSDVYSDNILGLQIILELLMEVLILKTKNSLTRTFNNLAKKGVKEKMLKKFSWRKY